MPIDPIRPRRRPPGGRGELPEHRPARVRRDPWEERPAPKDPRATARRFILKLRKILNAWSALVVDDEPEFCESFRQYLVSKGYQVTVAYSGDEALEAYEEVRPDVVFLDVRMPGKNGFQTLEELKILDPDAAVIMVSAVDDQDLIEEARSQGVFYVNKPIDFRYLERAIETTLGLRDGIVSRRG